MKKNEIIAYLKSRELQAWNLLKGYEMVFGENSIQSLEQLSVWTELFCICKDIGIEIEMEGRK